MKLSASSSWVLSSRVPFLLGFHKGSLVSLLIKKEVAFIKCKLNFENFMSKLPYMQKTLQFTSNVSEDKLLNVLVNKYSCN